MGVVFVKHEPCPNCGSRDNLGRYSDGSGYCYGCRSYYQGEGAAIVDTQKLPPQWLSGEAIALPNRGLTKETCQFWGYEVGEDRSGQGCHIANYRDASGALVKQKVRSSAKKFTVIGGGELPLYGLWLWGKGKAITVTEGEIDALTVSQVMQNKWPVVSIPNGASAAAKDLARHYDYLDQFERVVLMFDQDDVGRKAAEDAAAVLPPGKAFIAVLPAKDANETLLKAGSDAVVKAFWNAKAWRPDGIVSGADLTLERIKQAAVTGFPLPYPKLQEMVLGLRKGELTLLTAGSGIGKSSWARELAYLLHQQHGCKIGNVFLEEANAKTAQGYVALHHNVPLGRLRLNPSILTDVQWHEALRDVVAKGMYFYDHFGSLEASNLLAKLNYMATVCKVDFIILDHISIVTSGVESSSEGERKDIDILMTKLRSLIEKTGIGIIAIVHLKRAKDKSFNEGSAVSLNDLRGSGSLEQLSDNVYALERDQQADGDAKLHALIRVLKCRETGESGEADTLLYRRDIGRLVVLPDDPNLFKL